MNNILILTGGIFWLLVYIEIIRKGFKDKTYGMPLAALLVNISWEFISSFVFPAEGIQLYINYLWFFLDLVILLQLDRKSTRLNSSHVRISYAVFCLKKKKKA